MSQEMIINLIIGLTIPFLGTTLGSACVYLIKDKINPTLQKSLLGFASGVMVAASIWSLIIPAINQSASLGKLNFMPAAIGVALGMLFLFLIDKITPHLHIRESSTEKEGPASTLKDSAMLFLAVTIHNIPEGMAVGIIFAGYIANNVAISSSAALALAIGIAIQNFPEGAVVSLPFKIEGRSKNKAFLFGTLSGAVEPIAAIITILLAYLITPAMPYLLSFAAGAMFYVVVEELIPEASEEPHSNGGVLGFGFGFILMMILDIALS